jgi:excisionase family DNA binding protein
MPSNLVNVAETAEMLRLKPSTLRAWVLRRRIPYVKLGRRVMFRRSDVEALIARSVVPARSEFLTEAKLQPKMNSNTNQSLPAFKIWDREQPAEVRP